MNKIKICEKCGKELNIEYSFYYTNNQKQYPDNHLNICKDCITTGIDNYNPDTYLWILKMCDMPYYPSLWKRLLIAYPNESINKKGIIRRYIIRMKLKGYRDWRWADSELPQELIDGSERIG